MSDDDKPSIHVIGLDDNDNVPDFIKKMIADVLNRIEKPEGMPMQMLSDLTKKAADDAWSCLQRTSGLADRMADQYFITQKALAVLMMAFTDQCCMNTHVSDEDMSAHIRKSMNKAIDDALALRKKAKAKKGESINDAATPSNIQELLDGFRASDNR